MIVQVAGSANVSKLPEMVVYELRFWGKGLFYQIGELVKQNYHTIWVKCREVTTPKGRLIRRSKVIKRHILKHRVLFYDQTIKELYVPLMGGKIRKYVDTPKTMEEVNG
jgi:hypothetical protein